jgi:serine/threonine-protein kinase
VEIAVEVACQTASALAAAHSKGIVHRDLKPDNLFLVPDEMVGSGERVKVLDFGIAKLRDDMRGSSMKTRTGAIMGTAAYMSPEQCQGLIERIDHRTDIYALGVILYEMLCGTPPFVSEGFGDIIIMHVMRPPEPPQSKNPAIPDSVAAAMLCALAKGAGDRFQSMAEFQAALRGPGAAHLTPVFGAGMSPMRTAILDEQHGMAAQRAMPFDRTMATPPPVPVGRTPSWPPSHISTMVDPSSAVPPPATPIKQSTTFRNATGELGTADINLRGKRSTVVAIAAVVALAAAGLIITLLVTRPSVKPPITETTTTAAPADPMPPPPSPTLPPQAEPIPAVEPPRPLPAEPAPQALKNPRRPPGRVKRIDKPLDRPDPQPDPGTKKDTERW